jgi:hypothetical protein
MAKKVTHYVLPEDWGGMFTECNRIVNKKGVSLNHTSDVKEVNCKQCLKRLKRKPKLFTTTNQST